MCEVKRTAESLDASDQLRQRVSALEAERDTLAAEKADCEKFLKEGERLDECLERWRADALAVLKLLTQEKKKSEALAAEVVKLLAACAAKDAALRMLDTYMAQQGHAPLDGELIRAALSTDAGRNYVGASGAVEGKVEVTPYQGEDLDGNPLPDEFYVICTVPSSWAGKPVLIVPKPEGWK